jgi:Bacterial SH3 domain
MLAALVTSGCGETMSMPEFRSPIVFRSEKNPPARTAPSGSRPTVAVAQVGDEPSNLRDGPGTRYRVIGVASPGSRVEVLGNEAGWLEIRNGDGTAWVAERLTRAGSAAAAAEAPSSPPPAGAGPPQGTEPHGEDSSVLPDF